VTEESLRLAESEQRYRAVIDNAWEMIQSVRPDGSFEFVNQAWLDTLGYAAEDLAGLDVWDIIHESSVEHCQVLFQEAIKGRPIPSMDAVFVTKDGRAVPVEGSVTSRLVGEEVVATHGFFRDLSERLRSEELERRNAELLRAEQARYLEKMAALGKLSAGLAHELNNPAAAVGRAVARLGEALVDFERCGAHLWARQAGAELRAGGAAPGGTGAGEPPRHEGRDLARLTPQQLRIARRVAEGATNREVALSLSVSTRTVDYHLRNVFATLGVRSRVELVRLVEQAEKAGAHL